MIDNDILPSPYPSIHSSNSWSQTLSFPADKTSGKKRIVVSTNFSFCVTISIPIHDNVRDLYHNLKAYHGYHILDYQGIFLKISI